MKKHFIWKQALMLVLCAAMAVSAVPMAAADTLAAGCTHTHDTACGYAEGMVGSQAPAAPCTHTHSEGCALPAAESSAQATQPTPAPPQGDPTPTPLPTARQAQRATMAGGQPRAAGSQTVTIAADDTSTQLQAKIQAAIDAVGAGGTVTVTGATTTNSTAREAVVLQINNVTVLWQATYTAREGLANMIEISAASSGGTFVVNGGTINTTAGYAICVFGAPVDIEVRSGLVRSHNNGAIICTDDHRGTITIGGGRVQSDANGVAFSAIYSSGGKAIITGGTVVSTGTTRAVRCDTVTVSGGEVIGPTDLYGFEACPTIVAKTVTVTGEGRVTSTIGPAIMSTSDANFTVCEGGVVSGGCKDYPAILLKDKSVVTVGSGGLVEATAPYAAAIGIEGLYTAAPDRVTVDGGTVRATGTNGKAIEATAAGTLGNVVVNSGTVQATGTGGIGISVFFDAERINVKINGGTVQGTSAAVDSSGNITVTDGTVQSDRIAIHSCAAAASKKTVTVSGGTVSGGTYAINNSTVQEASTVVISGDSTVVQATNANGTAIQCRDKVTINGGTVQATHASNSAYAICAYARVEVNGGTVKNAAGTAIRTYDTTTINYVTINGGTVETETGTAIHALYAQNAVTVNGGTVQATGAGGTAIKGNGSITVGKAGEADTMVRATSGNAINSTAATATVTITDGVVMNETAAAPAIAVHESGSLVVNGGLVFSYGTGIQHITSVAGFAPTSPGVLAAWDTTDGTGGPYVAGEDDDLFMNPESTAYWGSNAQNEGGVAWANGANVGFLPLGVTVTKPDPTLANFNYTIANAAYSGTPNSVAVAGTNGFDANSGGAITVTYTGTDGTSYGPSTTAPTNVGSYAVSITTAGGTAFSPITSPLVLGSFTVSPLPLQVLFVVPANRLYDGTNVVAFRGGTLSGVAPADANDSSKLFFTLGTGTMENADIGENKAVTLPSSLVTLGGSAAGNYTLTQPTDSFAVKISPQILLITNVAATNRAYDGTTAVTLTGGSLIGVPAIESGDVGFILGSGTLENANAGTAKAVHTDITLTGATAGNYILAPPMLWVDIAKLPAVAGNPQTLHVAQGQALAYSYNLSALLPSLAAPAQLGAVTYTVVGTGGDSADVFTASPTDADIADGNISLAVAAADAGKSAFVTIKVASENYEDFTVVLTVAVADKTPLTPAFTVESGVYNTSAYAAGGIRFAKADGSGSVSLAADAYSLVYQGVGSTAYGPSTTAPKNAGSYTATLAVNDSNATYLGTTTKAFTIGQRPLTLCSNRIDLRLGDAMPALTYAVQNLAPGETAADALATAPTLAHNVPDTNTPGVYAITLTGGVPSANYTIAAREGSLLTVSDYCFVDSNGDPLSALPTYTNPAADYVTRINADYSKFFDGATVIGEVLVNGNTLTAGVHYTHAEGSTVITLTPAYLRTLANGSHTLTVRLADGAVSLPFAVNVKKAQHGNGQTTNAGGTAAQPAGTSAPTGDVHRTAVWAVCMALAAAALVACIAWHRRKDTHA